MVICFEVIYLFLKFLVSDLFFVIVFFRFCRGLYVSG